MFSKWRFWWTYAFWSPLNPKIPFLADDLCACVFLFMSFCLSVISITQKEIIVVVPNLVFYIYIVCRCYLKLFMKIGQTICIGNAWNYFKNFQIILMQCSTWMKKTYVYFTLLRYYSYFYRFVFKVFPSRKSLFFIF